MREKMEQKNEKPKERGGGGGGGNSSLQISIKKKRERERKVKRYLTRRCLNLSFFLELSAGRAPFAGIKNSMARIIRREMEKLEGRGDKASVLDSETPFISSNGILY